MIYRPGKRFIITSVSGVSMGPGNASTRCCDVRCGKPKTVILNSVRPSLIVNRLKPLRTVDGNRPVPRHADDLLAAAGRAKAGRDGGTTMTHKGDGQTTRPMPDWGNPASTGDGRTTGQREEAIFDKLTSIDVHFGVHYRRLSRENDNIYRFSERGFRLHNGGGTRRDNYSFAPWKAHCGNHSLFRWASTDACLAKTGYALANTWKRFVISHLGRT